MFAQIILVVILFNLFQLEFDWLFTSYGFCFLSLELDLFFIGLLVSS
uniref:Uncharacterized protein n=1 Tax=Rhizophora mucronata TaxID=61149 RepID=A0A2P2P5D6_RHIMU